MLWPPYILRPTWRLANCTGMRRTPCSMNTMATSSATNMRAMATMAHQCPTRPAPCAKLAGSRLTTEAKMRIDMPLPMPRWVTTSPNHMSRAKPAVRVSTTRAKRPAL